MRKSEIIRSGRRLPKPVEPNRFWEASMSYIWCGRDGWCYASNVLDVFTRQWLGFAFDTRRDHVDHQRRGSAQPGSWRADHKGRQRPQYTSRDFRRSMDVFEARLEYICVNTPQQNGHIESFHKTLKKEYV